jgi:hypothetical protein
LAFPDVGGGTHGTDMGKSGRQVDGEFFRSGRRSLSRGS